MSMKHDATTFVPGATKTGELLAGESHGLLGRQPIAAVLGLQVPGGGVGAEPLAHQPGMAGSGAASASAVSG